MELSFLVPAFAGRVILMPEANAEDVSSADRDVEEFDKIEFFSGGIVEERA